MTYDLRNPFDRKRFAKRANQLLRSRCSRTSLSDESSITPNQMKYAHVLFRIMAMETGVSEKYAKQVYFKEIANPSVFIDYVEDPVTGERTKFIKSTTELSKNQMWKAIDEFRLWAGENGYYLPEAHEDSNGELKFKSDDDKEAFNAAIIATDKVDIWINK